ncbi:MAG: CoA transferase [Candidatus Limnocylindrales bacterium]
MTGPLASLRFAVRGSEPGLDEAAALLTALGARVTSVRDRADLVLGDAGSDADGATARASLTHEPGESVTALGARVGLTDAALRSCGLLLPDLVVTSILGAWLALDGVVRSIAIRRGSRAAVERPAAVDVLLASLGPSLAGLASGERERPMGSGMAPAVPVDCADGAVLFGVATDADWGVVVRVIGDPRLGADSFLTIAGRLAAAGELSALLGEWAATIPRAEVVQLAGALRIPVAPLYEVADAAADPHLAPRLASASLPFAEIPSGRPTPPTSAPISAGRGRARAPLAGLVVVDLTSLVAGPLATRLLADYGATVVKVEAPDRLDGTRSGGANAASRAGSTFDILNRGKLGVALDLRAPDQRARFERLAAMAHLGVDSYTPRVLPALGLPVDGLIRAHPGLGWLSVSGYGLAGPYSDHVALDASATAVTGLTVGAARRGTRLTAQPFGWPMIDTLTGLHASLGAAALLFAGTSGRAGGWLGSALVDTGLLLARRLEEGAWRHGLIPWDQVRPIEAVADLAVRALPARTWPGAGPPPRFVGEFVRGGPSTSGQRTVAAGRFAKVGRSGPDMLG